MPFDKSIFAPRIHPLALPAFDTIADLLPMNRLFPPRALKVDGELLIFAGFSGLGSSLSKDDIEIISDMPDAEIVTNAWQEVVVIWQIMTIPNDVFRRFGDGVAKNAPSMILKELNLPARCDGKQDMRRWPIARRARRNLEGGVPFDRAKALYEKKKR